MVVFSGTVQSDFLKFLPSNLDNKEKLIDFAASDFTTLRNNLISYTKATFPLDYGNFSESDFGMLLIELMAAVGHIQSHKSDYLANESFIRTARERASVKKLLELVGVRMKGPISAVAQSQITFNAPVNNCSSLTVGQASRTFTVNSPEDGGVLTYTLYKVNSNGTVDLDNNSNDLVFQFSPISLNDEVTVTSSVLMEGSLVIESGTFQSVDAIKNVALTQFPYVEKSAQVFVNGSVATAGIYKEESNIYFASGATDKIFQVTTDGSFKASILFGDNTIGMAPAVGDSYEISYRVGGGTRGNLSESYINAPIQGIASNGTPAQNETANGNIQNNSLATGGADAESIGKAKRYAPLTFRSQDRLVTLPDYKAFANTFVSNYGSTGKATASVRRAFSSANTIDVFILEKASNTQLRSATPEYKKQLLEAIVLKKMLTDAPVIVDGLIRTLDLQVTLTLDRKFEFKEPQIVSKVKSLILSYFHVDNTDFAQAFHPQDLVKSVLQEESQVRFLTVDNINDPITVAFNEIIQLNNFTIRTEYV
tara:strand:- start:1915 stop:3528 length:1614 start_codon:yes stop_codon:yes gene_type:complete